MNRPAWFLAWRYVATHRLQAGLLTAALGLVLALPLCLHFMVRATQQNMEARAQGTPQLLGARGSALDLMLAGLYFKRQALPALQQRDALSLRQSGLAQVIPLDLRFHAQGAAIVGTELDYFAFRGLKPAQGRLFARLGECVVGAALAGSRGLKVGDSVYSSQEQLFDLAGVYPLKMRISGVLAPNSSADDEALFVDLKTAWIIAGMAHGHDDVAKNKAEQLSQSAKHTVANASVRTFNEVTPDNEAGFHFHGNTQDYPLSAAIVLPRDAKAEAILAGRFQGSKTQAQLIRPAEQYRTLISTLFELQRLSLALFAAILLAASAIAALVFALSFRLRQREFHTLTELGVPAAALRRSKLLEVVIIGLMSIAGSLILSSLVAVLSHSWVRWLLS
jgi:putative ABC transport system permease protein